MGLYEDITSGDPHRIWSSSCQIRQLRDAGELAHLAEDLPTIIEATRGINLGGAFRPNSTHLDFALKKLVFVRSQSSCLCALYEQDDLYNPTQEQHNGHVRILETKLIDGKWVDHYVCECLYCFQKFEVKEQDYHYTWWQWKRTSSEPNAGVRPH